MIMKAKYILLIVYSFLLLYAGVKIQNYLNSSSSDKPEIISDTTLFENWYDRNKPANSKNKNIQKPKSIKYQNIDSSMNSILMGTGNILEVRKRKNMLNVLSYHNSKMLESSFLSGSDNFRITTVNGDVSYSEERKYFQFTGIRIGLGSKLIFKTGDRIFYVEAGSGFRILNNFNLELKLNSLPEISLIISYNLD